MSTDQRELAGFETHPEPTINEDLAEKTRKLSDRGAFDMIETGHHLQWDGVDSPEKTARVTDISESGSFVTVTIRGEEYYLFERPNIPGSIAWMPVQGGSFTDLNNLRIVSDSDK